MHFPADLCGGPTAVAVSDISIGSFAAALRSVNNIVIAPAKTGKDKSNKKAVTKTDQTNKGILCIVIPGPRILKIVVIKFIEPNIEDIPDK